MAATLMLQGCGSDVGKSVLVAGLCRLFAERGYAVRPFKPQNMSNNAAVTAEGGEIGRAQALQARACRVAPSVHMNPVLLKPESERGAQLVVRGEVVGRRSAAEHQGAKSALLPTVLDSFARLSAEADLVVVEGAGSPAEVNLRSGDIANMGFARAAGVPVVLVGDIDRGHVIAALAGARTVMAADDVAQVAGFIVNKFRGDPALFASGREAIGRFTGWRDFGLVPWLAPAARLPAEDAVQLGARGAGAGRTGALKIAVLRLPRIANFDDFDPLLHEPGVQLRFTPPGEALPGNADLVILPGSKATLADLAALRSEGWDVDLHAHVRRGGRVVGVCGGYQMLGRRVADPLGLEGPPGEAAGLGLLEIDTVLTSNKVLRPVAGEGPGGGGFRGFEMHMGRTDGPGLRRPWLAIAGEGPHGAVSPDGRVAGGYVHGLFAAEGFRRELLHGLGGSSAEGDHDQAVEAALDAIAQVLETALDIEGLAALAGLGGPAA